MSHQYTSEIAAVKDWLSRVPMPQRTAHRAIMLIIRLDAEIERLEKRLEEEKHALFEQQAYTAELQAEIERLQKQLDSKCDRCIAREREKAIKEFAQLVKEHLDDFYHTDDGSLLDTVSMVDLLVKEMTEEQK